MARLARPAVAFVLLSGCIPVYIRHNRPQAAQQAQEWTDPWTAGAQRDSTLQQLSNACTQYRIADGSTRDARGKFCPSMDDLCRLPRWGLFLQGDRLKKCTLAKEPLEDRREADCVPPRIRDMGLELAENLCKAYCEAGAKAGKDLDELLRPIGFGGQAQIHGVDLQTVCTAAWQTVRGTAQAPKAGMRPEAPVAAASQAPSTRPSPITPCAVLPVQQTSQILEDEQLTALTDLFVGQLVSEGVSVIPSEDIRGAVATLKTASYKDRFSRASQVAIGKATAAKSAVHIQLSEVDGTCVVTAKLLDLASEVYRAASAGSARCAHAALVLVLPRVAERLAAQIRAANGP